MTEEFEGLSPTYMGPRKNQSQFYKFETKTDYILIIIIESTCCFCFVLLCFVLFVC